MSKSPYRTLIEGEGFANEKFSLCNDAEVLDDLLSDAMRFLSLHPEAGQPVGFGVYILSLKDWLPKKIDAFLIVYQFDENTVNLIAIKRHADLR